jgi:3-phenylpropionate/trans-cinnamate dioxygenase ferredoxin subunit
MSEFVKVCHTQDVPVEQVKVFDVSGKSIAICHTDKGFYAILDVCTHDGAPLDQGELVGCQIECPRHGARFDVTTGKVLCLPAVMPLPTFPVEVRNDELWVGVQAAVRGST